MRSDLFRLAGCLALTTVSLAAAAAAEPALLSVMPVPAKVERAAGRFALGNDLTVGFSGAQDARLTAGVSRALRRLEERTGHQFSRDLAPDPTTARLQISCAALSPDVPALGEDESYRLEITDSRIALAAPTSTGVLRGIETLLQLLHTDGQGFHFPALRIEDRPRFAWRGLMIDVARHWQPMEVIKRHLDGMALVKLNVFHFHLTEDQGFRIESKKYPKLHQLGSDGNYFTQEQIREIIAYAADRGIRVVPEFDIPGHATSWLVGHPELGSQPGPYKIERKWGIFQPVLDPTNEAVYELLDGFLGEMAALFPDPYLHIGGDEVEGKHWKANEKIQAFMRDRGIKDNAGLQAYFNQRVLKILTRHGKKMIGWDEIFHPDLPKDAMIHSWRGPDSLAEAARQGYAGILSNGYYIDLIYPTHEHYLNDPLPAGTKLSPEEQARVLGGEATMWAEWVSPETIDSRVWPRTAAIAERLWSRQEVRDVADMYRRLPLISRRLEEAGLMHERNVRFMLQRFAGDTATTADIDTLEAFAGLVEPVKKYRRGGLQKGGNQFTPLTNFVDIARPDATPAREFGDAVRRALFESDQAESHWNELKGRLESWKLMTQYLRSQLAPRSPRVGQLLPLFQKADDAHAIALEALGHLRTGQVPPAEWATEKLNALTKAFEPHGPVELMTAPHIRLLVAAAGTPRTTDRAAWRTKVEALAAPPVEKKPAATAH